MRDDLRLIRSDLATIDERLADIALELLQEAMGDADPKASPAASAERVVTRARRSVEKAVTLLDQLEGVAADDW